MAGLDEKYNMSSDSLLYKVFFDLALHLHDFYLSFKNAALPQLNILTATGEFVNNWGFLFSVVRQFNESDSDYAARIVRTFLVEKATPTGLLKALIPYAKNGEVQIIEGASNPEGMAFDLSYLGSQIISDNFTASGEVVTIPYDLNGLLGTTEVSRNTVFGSFESTGFFFIVRILIDDSVREQYFQIVKNIVDQYKIAGTSYEIYDLANGSYVVY
jgi:hypothetical protein